jgi:predicted unusual protein kinase regulating ubiquinone biosynthesis (AarF/ABC1/UbiB family)
MHRARYRRIVFFFARIILSLVLWDLILPRLGLRGWSRRTRPNRLRRSAAQFRALAIEMGGVLIKVGQFMSARVDVLPDEITSELVGLQDEVPEENYAQIRRLVEDEFGRPLDEKFVEFHEETEAAASLGQVHRARIGITENNLKNQNADRENESGDLLDVVVKVQRPDIETVIAIDLAALRTVGNWLRRYPPIRRRADVPALLDEFTRILYEEIDYIAEGHNAETFAENFHHRPGVHVPAVIWSHTTKRVLTLQDVGAIKITDYASITAAGVERAAVADRLFQTYLQQIFEDGFFHADPHPGNLFVTPTPTGSQFLDDERLTEDEADEDTGWQLTFVDFGMVGRMSPEMLSGLREMVIAVGTRDAAQLIDSYQKLGVLLPGADVELLKKASTRLFDQFWGKNMSELQAVNPLEMREFAREFRELIFDMPFQVPQDMILLGRTVGILSGMCTGLNPQFNVWEGIAPFAQQLIFEESGGERISWLNQLGNLVRVTLSYPRRAINVLGKLENGELEVRVPQLTTQVKHLEHAVNRLAAGLVFGALLLGGIQLYLARQIGFAVPIFILAFLTLLWITFHQ